MTDIVERLLRTARLGMTIGVDALLLEAADEIGRVRAESAQRLKTQDLLANEIERLRSCLYAQEDVKPLYDKIKRLQAEIERAKHNTLRGG